jgi:DNA-binding NarL/FixJ family response regulator
MIANDIVNYEQLKRDYPWIEFIGLVGFDISCRKFVLLEIGHQEQAPEEGDTGLSKREQEILQLVVEGYTNAQIAQKLVISENTVKAHMQSIFSKLKVRSRTQAAMYAVQLGWAIEKL